MQTKDLAYFKSVAHFKSISKAAQYHQVSQPTITIAIKRLESNFDTALIVRDSQHHTIHLTEQGTHLLAHATHILNELKETQREINALSVTDVLLGLPPIVSRYYFPNFVAKLNQADLLAHLTTQTAGSEKLLQLLVNGTINIALIGHTPQVDPNHQWQQIGQRQLLASYPFQVIDNSDQPFFPNNAPITPTDLKNVPLINFSDDFIHAAVLNDYVQSATESNHVIFTVSEIDILKEAVRQGLGVGILTELAVRPDDHLIAHTLTFPEPVTFNIYLVIRRDYQLNEMEQKFVNFFTENKL